MSTARVLVTSTNDDPVKLAVNYAALATSDEVTRAAISRDGVRGTLLGDSGYVNKFSLGLPTVAVSAITTSPAKSAVLANDGMTALKDFVARQEAESNLPDFKRSGFQLLNRALPAAAVVATPRSKTPPVVVFVLVMAATVGLVLILENLRPRVRVVSGELMQARASGETQPIRQQA